MAKRQVTIDNPPLYNLNQATRVDVSGISQTFSSGIASFQPAATPSDILALVPRAEDRVVQLKRVSITGWCETPYAAVSVQTASTGTNWATFSSQPAEELKIANDTGTDLAVRRVGSSTSVIVANGGTYTFSLISNCNQVQVKRIDDNNTQVTTNATYLNRAIDVFLQRAPNGGGGTFNQLNVARHDSNDTPSTAVLYQFTVNRGDAQGNGVSSTRPLLRAEKLVLGTVSAPGRLIWDFSTRGTKPIVLRSLVEWAAINLSKQTLPTGTTLHIDVEWTEERQKKVIFVGDSTFSNATFLFQRIFNEPKINSQLDVRNYGSNGYRALDILQNLNGVTYPLSAVMTAVPESYAPVRDAVVLGPGINDVRTGATTQAQLISILDAMIFAIRNGTVSGQTYTSNKGALTTFTWTQNITGNPDVDIILWGPNSLATDGNGASYVTATGIFSGMSIAQAAQAATDILYNAYQAFASDSRVKAVVQRQEVFGRTSTTLALSGLMTDILHPNGRGQKLAGQQILPYLIS